MWGKMKNTGDDWMYPKPLLDLRLCFCSMNFQKFLLFYLFYLVNFCFSAIIQKVVYLIAPLFGHLLDSGWNIRCMDSGSMHHFVGADSSCISWGHAQNGELGYGPNAQKYDYEFFLRLLMFMFLFLFVVLLAFRSSAVPKKVDILEGMHVLRWVFSVFLYSFILFIYLNFFVWMFYIYLNLFVVI